MPIQVCFVSSHNSINLMTSAFASSSLESCLRMWDLATGERVDSIDVGPVDIWTVAFSLDKFIISGNDSGKIILYGVESGKQGQTLVTRGNFTLNVAYVSREFNSCI